MGRKKFSAGSIGRASTTLRTGARTMKESGDIASASENLQSLHQQKTDLEAEFNAEMQALEGSTDPSKQAIETVAERPKKADVAVRLVALVWQPCWKTKDGIA
jgi:Sec-independent protein translocase protein TatA